MKFFGRKDPKEDTAKKLSSLKISDKAINLSETIKQDDFRLVVDVTEELITKGVLAGKLVGRKGWFLPNAEDKLRSVWDTLQETHVDLNVVSDEWGLNEKRVYIAIEEYIEEKSKKNAKLIREGMWIYLDAFFANSWQNALSKFDIENDVQFSKVISSSKVQTEDKKKYMLFIRKELSKDSSLIVVGSDDMLRTRASIPDVILDDVNQKFDDNADQVTYSELSVAYGISTDQVGMVLQSLIDKNLLENVTLYPVDELIKTRNI